MGLALAAELNGYPGPLHVIELADSLRLTPEQRARMEALHTSMTSEAGVLGERAEMLGALALVMHESERFQATGLMGEAA